MKKSLSLLSLLFYITFPAFTQNWAPTNSYELFHYRSSTNTTINTIKVDSVSTESEDSLFFFNRIIKTCDTCNLVEPYLVPPKLLNQPNFLQEKMRKTGDGSFVFEGGESFTLRPYALPGESWQYNPQGIIATVSLSDTATLFNLLDSIKIISLSNMDSIIISKNFGILQFPTDTTIYSLAGIEGRNIGLQVPQVSEIYDFNIGDVYQYRGTYFEGAFYSSENYTQKISILDKSIHEDTLHYVVQSIYNGTRFHPNEGYTIEVRLDTLEWQFINDSSHPANGYHLSLVDNMNNQSVFGNFDLFANEPLATPLTTLSVFEQEWDGIHKAVGSTIIGPSIIDGTPEASVPLFYIENDSFLGIPCCIAGAGKIYQAGLGMTYYFIGEFEVSKAHYLAAYVKGTDTVGVIFSDETLLLTSTASIAPVTSPLKIYPVPTTDELTIEWKEELQGTSLAIYSVSGQLITHIPIRKEQQRIVINTQNFLPGLYFVQVSTTRGDWFGKFIR